MKKFLALSIGILTLSAGAVFAAQDLYLKNLQICNPYKTVYKSPLTGENFEKAVLGVKIEGSTHNLYCAYYKQTAPNEYQLCMRRTNSLPTDKGSDKKVSCRMTDLNGINEARQAVSEKDYFLDVSTDVTITPVQGN